MGFYNGNVQQNIEDAILNTFFECELMGVTKDQLFKLDERNFLSHFKRRVVFRINECIDKNESLSLLAYTLVEKCKGSREDEMLEICCQNPLTIQIAKDYHNYLTKKRIERDLKLENL